MGAPPLAVVERLGVEQVPLRRETGFRIVPSESSAPAATMVAPDSATCSDCLAELFDPADRRYRYAFINCTNCGPRFTILARVPYDRANTSMSAFAMCEECAREYLDPTDRRHHAEPTCCPACGPTLRLLDAEGRRLEGDAVSGAASMIRDGAILAVKGLGGYHLAADATNEAAVGALRARKHREDRPFALMVADLGSARALCTLTPEEEVLLASPRRPIVLLERRPCAEVAPAVAPTSRRLGLMLAYTPLHHLLAREIGRPCVLTSGNVSDEPIAYRDEDVEARLARIADGFVVHDRAILVRADDSVTQSFRGRELVIRRSRGHAPAPVPLRTCGARSVLGCGAELKHTFCVTRGRHAFLSQHIGDLENYETLRSFTDGVEHLCRLLEVRPGLVAHDLHPEYLSTKYALSLEDVETLAVQHHHAHIASCLADNGHSGPVIGVAFDGLGYGPDGTAWGGELLVADLTAFERAGHLETVALPGGVRAIREPWRMAAAWLDAVLGDEVPEDLAVVRRNRARWADVVAIARSGLASPTTSSAGRLFDAVAAIVGVRDAVNYEGQAAVELEQLADASLADAYPVPLEASAGRRQAGPLVLAAGELVRAVVEDVRAGVEAPVVSARFHNGLAGAVVAACEALRARAGLSLVALSGGVFQNRLLLERVVTGLESLEFQVLLHSRVPPNDGGISLGQVAVASARDARRRR